MIFYRCVCISVYSRAVRGGGVGGGGGGGGTPPPIISESPPKIVSDYYLGYM